jgi:3-deoxy-manno-octulosonate cytidylyltransferase (CMP-KDO synthetase)
MPKVVAAMAPDGRSGRALYFTRSVLFGEGPVWIHHGIYGYRSPARLERIHRPDPRRWSAASGSEQLRALELGMTIWSAVLDEAPISVTTLRTWSAPAPTPAEIGGPA